MKRLIHILALVCCGLFISCNQTEVDKWEYRTMAVEAKSQLYPLDEDEFSDANARYPKKFLQNDIEDSLNIAGKEGWELVSMVPELETRYPLLGYDETDAAAIKSNVRTHILRFVFKRRVVPEN